MVRQPLRAKGENSLCQGFCEGTVGARLESTGNVSRQGRPAMVSSNEAGVPDSLATRLRRRRPVACANSDDHGWAHWSCAPGSDERRSTRDGQPIDGWHRSCGRIAGGTNPDDLDQWTSIGIGDDLTLSVEVADRAVVGRGVLLVGMYRYLTLSRRNHRRAVAETGQRVQRWAPYG